MRCWICQAATCDSNVENLRKRLSTAKERFLREVAHERIAHLEIREKRTADALKDVVLKKLLEVEERRGALEEAASPSFDSRKALNWKVSRLPSLFLTFVSDSPMLCTPASMKLERYFARSKNKSQPMPKGQYWTSSATSPRLRCGQTSLQGKSREC